MKSAVFIIARLGSSRLPKKHILKIDDKYCIEYVIERAKLVSGADLAILTTTNLPEDDILEDIALQHSIKVFRGDVEDKIKRCYDAATLFGVDFFVVAGGDNLFSEPELLDLAIQQYKESGADLITWEGTKLMCGSFNYGIKVSALKRIIDSKKTNDTEMISSFFDEKFQVEILKNIPPIYERQDIRATMDYPEDFRFFEEIILLAKEKGVNLNSLRDIIALVDENKHITEINQFRHGDWISNQNIRIQSIKRGDI